jgi:integrase
MAKLTKAAVDAAKPKAKPYFIWDSALPGFGLRVFPSGRKAFYLDFRVEGGARRRAKIGDLGRMTVDQGKSAALRMLSSVTVGGDPLEAREERRRAVTIEDVCRQYFAAGAKGLVRGRNGAPKTAAGLRIDQARVQNHILPLLGALPAARLDRAAVQRAADAITARETAEGGMRRARGGAGTARRTIALLGGIWTWAERRGLVPAGSAPARGIEKAAGAVKDRTLSRDELARLGAILREYEPIWNDGRGEALRLIALTALRRGEVLDLTWQEVDLENQCLRLRSSKTGASVRVLSDPAAALLRSLPRVGERVFPARLENRLTTIFRAAGVDAGPHDLRRTFASVGAELGLADSLIGELLGHAARGVTARHYIKRPPESLIEAANAIARIISDSLSGEARGGEDQE